MSPARIGLTVKLNPTPENKKCGCVDFDLSSFSCLLSSWCLMKVTPMARSTLLALLLVVFVAGVIVQRPASSQTPKAPPRRPPAELLRLSLAAETPGLAEPFKGITTNGVVEANLFKVRSTGVSTKPVQTAAERLLAGLTEPQRQKTRFAVDDPEWRKWMNQSFYVRQGVGFMEMTPAQRDLAFALFRAGLSAKGLTLTRNIMRLNETLAELTDGNFDEYGEWQYFVTVMGTPSATEPWGWQLDGHHVIVNYFVLGDQVVVTPFFAGSEPVTATSGKYPGHDGAEGRTEKALAFVNALDEPRRAKAVSKFSKAGKENLTEAWKDNVVIDYAGVRATDLRRRNGASCWIWWFVRGQHGRWACAGEDGGSARASRSHVFRLDREDGARQCLLLPDSESGDPHRVRSPAAGRHAASSRSGAADAAAHTYRRAHAQRERLRKGPASSALCGASALKTG